MRKTKKIIAFILSLALASGSAWMTNEKIRAVDWFNDKFELYYAGIRGDTDSDGMLTSKDILNMRNYVLGKPLSLNFKDSYLFDVNSDGKNNVFDVLRLKSAVLGNTRIWSYKNLPEMDGSTSAIPLEAGIKSKLLGIPYIAARNTVKHHKTHESFQMLLSGDIDMIFTVPISESQEEAADEAGVQLTQIPVAKEGFVFAVNKENPVDSLTMQQIKDIYSGKITNWSEVGGNDEPIIPYQRNEDSGSQNYMVEFMKDSELISPPGIYRIGSMGQLLDAVAAYDNSSQAIGYSVYSYAAQMYENSSSIKFIAVDGVRPSRETMADDTYPLLSNTYIMYTDKVSKDTLEFTDWVVSEEGQQCILKNGYIPVKSMEYPDWLKPFNATGTGKEKTSDYTPSEKYSLYTQSLSGQGSTNFRLNCLKDKNLEDKINNDIKEAITNNKVTDKYVSVKAVNGYLSIEISSVDRTNMVMDNFVIAESYSEPVTLNYDLRTGKKIEKLSDYFYKDINFADIVNTQISNDLSNYPQNNIKSDFIGLTGEIKNFTSEVIYPGEDNYFYTDNIALNYSSYFLPDYMVTGEYYDMKDLFENPENVTDVFYPKWNYTHLPIGNNSVITTIDGSRFYNEEECSEKRKIYDKIASYIKEQNISKSKSFIIDTPENNVISKYLNVYSVHENRSILMSSSLVNGTMFDPETGERVYFSDIFGEKFREIDTTISLDDYYTIDNLETGNGTVKVYLNSTMTNNKIITIDAKDLNMKYIRLDSGQ